MLIVNVYLYKTFKERIKLVKQLRGRITIESTYIMAIQSIKGDN